MLYIYEIIRLFLLQLLVEYNVAHKVCTQKHKFKKN